MPQVFTVNGHAQQGCPPHHTLAVAVNFFAHNFMRVHSDLLKVNGKSITLAMMHGLAGAPWTAERLVAAITADAVTIEQTQSPGLRPWTRCSKSHLGSAT